jgi:hypothetical protein
MKIVFHIWTVHSIDHISVLDVHNKLSSSPLAFSSDVECFGSVFGMRLLAAMKIYWYFSKCDNLLTSGCMNQVVFWRPFYRAGSGLDIS